VPPLGLVWRWGGTGRAPKRALPILHHRAQTGWFGWLRNIRPPKGYVPGTVKKVKGDGGSKNQGVRPTPVVAAARTRAEAATLLRTRALLTKDKPSSGAPEGGYLQLHACSDAYPGSQLFGHADKPSHKVRDV
jgi:hypothetical protein